MNENSANNSKCPLKVVSKYFTSSPVMDESLSEFKEKKKGITGPKTTLKPVASKGRVKKAPKHIKGQKDIRNALKPKKNVLLAYAKEFDEVCKQSGVDVDSEQLQLAIALSKSIEPAGFSADNECSSNQESNLNAKGRSGNIRTTLQQYGFTVPEIKITSNKRRKKTQRKNYKLLLATDAEKQQIISDRYSQAIFHNVCDTKERIHCENSLINKRFYYLSTNISYTELKNNNVLYVDELIAQSSTKGVLLRDWADIPGRPHSPKVCENIKMNFSEIECSQEELDIVLSGTLKYAKTIVQKKSETINKDTPIIVIDDCIHNAAEAKSPKEIKNKSCTVTTTECLLDNNVTSNASDRIRSKSPDIFDDEVSEILDSSNSSVENCKGNNYVNVDLAKDADNNVEGTTGNVKKVADNAGLNFLDVGNEFNNKHSVIENNKDSTVNLIEGSPKDAKLIENNLPMNSVKFTFSQESNFTRRNSDDFMEITECVTNFSGVGSQNKNKTRRITNDLMEITECVDKRQSDPVNIKDNIDLTQKSDENNDATILHPIVTNINGKIVDLSQSSNSEDELPDVQISGSNRHSLDDTILLNSDEIQINNNYNALLEQRQNSQDDNLNTLDLTQTPPDSVNRKSASQSFFDEFIHNHSDDTGKETVDISKYEDNRKICINDEIDLTQPNLNTSNVQEDIEVDLTQSSKSSNDTMIDKPNESIDQTPVKSNLGKQDEISIDYDELFDNVTQEHTDTNSKSDYSSHKSVIYDIPDDNEGGSESNRSSQVFNLSDKELEYSLNQSRNYLAFGDGFGGISVMDNMPGVGKKNSMRHSHDANNSIKKSMSESFLPDVNIKGYNLNVNRASSATEVNNKNDDKPFTRSVKTTEGTPYKAFAKENECTTETPKNSEYIIKTDQVTPLMDYASMSTPERNRELDKYGLKPFKRKRAIQLLTHLYNQTHPIVEACKEDLPSPSKKRKHATQPSPIKMKSPTKSLKAFAKSPIKFSQNEIYPEIVEDGNLYEVTNETPEIRDIACSEEDWVFQKREKAKLHSCKMPLHIAFHNYVSCRRRLREAILKYEPVNIDIIHKGLVGSGYRYDPKELLKYMDKKCITVKTADNNGRNNR